MKKQHPNSFDCWDTKGVILYNISGTKAYKETSEEEKSVVNGHCNHLALKFSVCVKERQDRLPAIYWLPKLHKTPYKARFIANSSSCTTTELSKLLTSCLTAVKNHVIRYCEKVYERSGKNLFWLLKILVRDLINESREDSVRPVCQLMIFPHSIQLCPII